MTCNGTQALVEESARQQRAQQEQRQLEERQKLQQAMIQVATQNYSHNAHSVVPCNCSCLPKVIYNAAVNAGPSVMLCEPTYVL